MMANEQTEPQTERPMAQWRVTLHCWVGGRVGHTEIVHLDVSAPDCDPDAIAKAGWQKMRRSGRMPADSYVYRIDFTRLDEPTDEATVPTPHAQQPGLWDEVAEMEA